MKRILSRAASVTLLALMLAGCAQKAVWMPLFDPPDPNWTPSHTEAASVAPGGQNGEDDENRLFATETESMAYPRVIIYKSKHVLEVWDGSTLMARMRVALGRTEGPKQKSGDSKTPEGEYYVCKQAEEGRYYKSLFISYPNASDALAGLEKGRIKQQQYDQIASAIDRRQIPLWDTDLGGEIAISGTGTIGKDRTGDWTAGNVSVSDSDMDYLWQHIAIGVDVEIVS